MRSMMHPATTSLPPAARDYLAQVAGQLRDLDRALRTRLTATAAENLAERPRADTLRELAAALGSPRDYADMLRGEIEAAEPGIIELSHTTRRHRRRWTIGIALVVIAALVGTGIWWVTWQADIQSNSLRVCDNAATLDQESCGQSEITDLYPADMMEVTCDSRI